jgi:LysM repeat protein
MSASILLKIISEATDNLFDIDYLRPYANQLADASDKFKKAKGLSDDPDVDVDYKYYEALEEITELEAKVFLREKIDKSLEELREIPEFKNYQEGDWETFSRARGYNEDEIYDFETLKNIYETFQIEEGGFSAEVQSILNKLRNEYNKYKIDVPEEKILDKDLLPAVDFFANKIYSESPVLTTNSSKNILSKQGAEILARNYIVKILDEEKEIADSLLSRLFSKVPEKQTVLDEPSVDAAVRAANLEEGIRSSVVKKPVFRSYYGFQDLDYDPSFVFPREMGAHTGTRGQAHSIIQADIGNISVNQIPAKAQEIEPQKMLADLIEGRKKAQQRKEDKPNYAITKGYVNIRNPLKLTREPMSWKASELMTMSGEFINAIESQSKILPNDFNQELESLTQKAFEIETKFQKAPELVSLNYNLFKNEVLDANLTKDVQKFLNKAGFDSIEYVNEVENSLIGEGPLSYILFSPYQFKSAYSKAFDFEDPRTAYALGGLAKGAFKLLAPAVDGLYSPAEKAALNLQQKSGSGQSFINAIKKGEGVKEEELQATGFIDAFKDKKKVDLEEVQDFLSSNRYDLETERSDNAFIEYSMLSDSSDSMDIDGKTYANIFKIPEGEEGSYYRPAHFSEGTLAHTRVTLLPESGTNKQIYVIEEVQSDLHQDGRNYGYYSKEAAEKYDNLVEELGPEAHYAMDDVKKRKEALDYMEPFLTIKNEDELEDALDEFEMYFQGVKDHINYLNTEIKESEYFPAISDFFDNIGGTFTPVEIGTAVTEKLNRVYGDTIDKLERDFIVDSMTDLFFTKGRNKKLERFKNIVEYADEEEMRPFIEAYINRHKDFTDKIQKAVSRRIEELAGSDYEKISKLEKQALYGVPNVPYKKDWYKLALRKSLIDAANQDFDKVGLTTAKIQAERYGLEYDLAEGFVKYYDEIYPKFLKDFGKKYGADVELTEVKSPSGKTYEIWAMELTPEMKKDIKKGLPKFAEGGYVIKRGDTLLQIASKNNTTVEELARLNNIEDINFIRAGDKLKLTESVKEKQSEPEVTKVNSPKKSRGTIPTNLKQFVKDLFGSDDLLTEEDITPEEKEALVAAVKKAKEQNKNILEYNDYQTQKTGEDQYKDVSTAVDNRSFFSRVADPSYSMKTTIGQAQIKEDEEGNTIVLDRYNFNDAKTEFDLVDFLKGVRSAGGSVYGQARNIGRWFGSSSEEGSSVAINLGKIDTDAAFTRNS